MAHKPRLNHTAPARTKHFIVYQEPVTLYYTSWIFQAPLNYRRIIAGTIISDRAEEDLRPSRRLRLQHNTSSPVHARSVCHWAPAHGSVLPAIPPLLQMNFWDREWVGGSEFDFVMATHCRILAIFTMPFGLLELDPLVLQHLDSRNVTNSLERIHISPPTNQE